MKSDQKDTHTCTQTQANMYTTYEQKQQQEISLWSKVQGHRASRQEMPVYLQGMPFMKSPRFFHIITFKIEVTGPSVKALWVKVLAA